MTILSKSQAIKIKLKLYIDDVFDKIGLSFLENHD